MNDGPSPQGDSLFYSPSETVHYREKHWPEDSYMLVRKYRIQADVEDAVSTILETKVDYDPDEEMRRKKAGIKEEYRGESIQRQRKTGVLALAENAVVEWYGRAFWLPPKYTYRSGQPHPYAGRQIEMPCTPENIALLPPKVLRELELYLRDLYEHPENADLLDARFQTGGPDSPRQPEPDGTTEADTVAAGA